MLQDLRFAARALRRAPGFTLFVVLLLGLGIGASTAVFSIIDAVVLRPLPYREPDRLVAVWETNIEKSLGHEPMSPVNFVDYRGLHQAFSDGAAWWKPVIDLTETSHEPLRVASVETTANLFAVLGVEPMVGRGFEPEPAFDPRVRQAMISNRLWRTRFGADANIANRTIRLNGDLYAVVGVMPPGFNFPGDTDVWQRMTWDPARHSRGAHFMESVFRLARGVSAAQADRELNALTLRLANEFGRTNRGWSARAIPLDRDVVGSYRPALLALLGASGLLLLITCLNLANVLLARAMAREPEIAIRAAIGAGRSRVLRQFAAESLLLAVIGAAAGLATGALLVRLLRLTSIFAAVPRIASTSIGGARVLFAGVVTLAAALLFSVVPAAALMASDPVQALRTGRGSSLPKRHRMIVLAGAEIAIAVVLLTASGLLVRSVGNLLDEQTGIRRDGAYIVNVDLPYSYEWQRIPVFYRQLLDRLRTGSRVDRAGASAFGPLAVGWRLPFRVEGRGAEISPEPPIAQHHVITPGYFAAVGAVLAAGRDFDATDTTDRPGVAIVNEALARRQWPGRDPLGATILTTFDYIGPLGRNLVADHRCEVIGVVRDIRNASVATPAEPAIYFPLDQFAYRNLQVTVRGTIAEGDLQTALRSALHALDPDLSVSRVTRLSSLLDDAVERPRTLMWLLGAFAAAATVLAVVGLYGSLSCQIAQRRQELGLRAALGADPGALVWLVVRQALIVAAIGAAAGIAASVAAGRALAAFLYGVRVVDVTTYAGVAIVLLSATIAASLVPARRAAMSDPLIGLKSQ